MTVEKFREKWAKEISEGIVTFQLEGRIIRADRFDGSNFLCDRNLLNKIQNDLREMDYNRIGIGCYIKL